MDKQKNFFHGNGHIRKGHRVAGDITSADIKQPGNIVQRGKDVDGGIVRFHFLPQLGNLFFCRLACVFFLQHPHLPLGQGGPVLPDMADEGFRIGKRSIFLLQAPLQILAHAGIEHPPVKPQDPRAWHILFQKLFYRGDPRLPHLHQLYAASGKLRFRLHKVSPVRPKPRLSFCYHRRSRRAGKSGNIFPAGKMLPYVLRFMVIGSWHQVNINPPFPH